MNCLRCKQQIPADLEAELEKRHAGLPPLLRGKPTDEWRNKVQCDPCRLRHHVLMKMPLEERRAHLEREKAAGRP